MPRVSESYRQAQRETVLDAAEACFARLGAGATRVDDIVAESGLSVGAIYRYFRSKDEIMTAVAERYRARDREAVAAIQARGRPVREQIFETLTYFSARPADRVAIEAMNLVSGRDGREQDRWTGLLADYFETAQAEGHVRADIGATEAARLLLLVFEGLAVLTAAGVPARDERLLEAAATVIADGLAPQSAGVPVAEGTGVA